MFINMNKYIEFVYKYEHYFTLVLIGKTPDVQSGFLGSTPRGGLKLTKRFLNM